MIDVFNAHEWVVGYEECRIVAIGSPIERILLKGDAILFLDEFLEFLELLARLAELAEPCRELHVGYEVAETEEHTFVLDFKSLRLAEFVGDVLQIILAEWNGLIISHTELEINVVIRLIVAERSYTMSHLIE